MSEEKKDICRHGLDLKTEVCKTCLFDFDGCGGDDDAPSIPEPVVGEAQAYFANLTDATLAYRKLQEEKDEAERKWLRQYDELGKLQTELEEARKLKGVLREAYTLLNHMGDQLNGMDAVEDGDEEMAAPIFARVRHALGEEHPDDLQYLTPGPTETWPTKEIKG